MGKIVRPDKLKEGEKGIIIQWVNRPEYIGDTIRMENGKLIRTIKEVGIDTEMIDMDYQWWCKVELDDTPLVVEQSEQLKCQCKKAQFTRTVDADFNPLCGRCGKAL
jgi:hypothetical protein